MSDVIANVRIYNIVGLFLLVVLWIVLCECVHVGLRLLRREPLIGWAVGPLGVTVMFLHEPSLFYICLDVLCPAIISGGFLYIALYNTTISPLVFPYDSPVPPLIVCGAVVIVSVGTFIRVWQDVRYPLWGEARVLRTIQKLRSSWASIHFTPFGCTYLLDHFGSNPTDLLQAL
jgi:hypothetical protein